MDLQRHIEAEVERILPVVVKIRRDIHTHPECGYQEIRAPRLIASELRKSGIGVKTGITKTGIVGLLHGLSEGCTIAIRDDMDALPIRELRKVEYRSAVNGIMCACGHDARVAMVPGAGFFAYLTIEYLRSRQ